MDKVAFRGHLALPNCIFGHNLLDIKWWWECWEYYLYCPWQHQGAWLPTCQVKQGQQHRYTGLEVGQDGWRRDKDNYRDMKEIKGTLHLSNGTFILCFVYLDTFLRPPMFLEFPISPFFWDKKHKMCVADHFEMWFRFFELSYQIFFRCDAYLFFLSLKKCNTCFLK